MPIEVASANAMESGLAQLQTPSPEQQPVLLRFETHYLYEGQMSLLEQDCEDGTLKQSRMNLLGAKGIEAVIAVDHTRGDQATLQWLFYNGHGNVVRTMSSTFSLLAFQWRGVWGKREGANASLQKGYSPTWVM